MSGPVQTYEVFDNGRLIGAVEADSLRKALEGAKQKFPQSISRIQVKRSLKHVQHQKPSNHSDHQEVRKG